MLALLEISSHLPTNTFAKEFFLLSPEERFTVLGDDQSEYEETSTGIQGDQKTNAASNDESSVMEKEIEPPVPGKFTSYEAERLYKSYTKFSAAFGSIAILKKASGLSRESNLHYLQSKSPYTKYKQFRKIFPRLKIVSYRINEIWSVDLAYKDKVPKQNKGFKCFGGCS